MFAVREPTDGRVTFDGLPELRVTGLPDAEAAQLVATTPFGRMDARGTCARCLRSGREPAGARRARGRALARPAFGWRSAAGAAPAQPPSGVVVPPSGATASRRDADVSLGRSRRADRRSRTRPARRRQPGPRPRRAGTGREAGAAAAGSARRVPASAHPLRDLLRRTGGRTKAHPRCARRREQFGSGRRATGVAPCRSRVRAGRSRRR